jgi:multidrug transporter EmrE-like cation transporter
MFMLMSVTCNGKKIGQVAVLFFNDPFTWLKGLGLATIIFGVSLFNLYK